MTVDFTKFGLAVVAVGMVFSSASAEMIGNIEFPGFVKHIEKPIPSKESNARDLPQSPIEALKKATRKAPSRFVGWNAENPFMPSFVAKSADDGEKMDSVVGIRLDGSLMSKQVFSFTETGRPLESLNYLPTPDGTAFQYAGHYAYEYDGLGRLISAEQTDVDYPNRSQRIEYGYSGDAELYNLQIAYIMDSEGDWMPYQKGEYTFDANYNTTEEVYYSWGEDVSAWLPAKKTVATYDEMNRVTSYFPYTWDSETNDWGYMSGSADGHRYEYTQNGSYALKADYEWRNNQWIEFYRIVDTYNDAALMVKREHLYWNREKQDWSGAETWGRWDREYFNSYEIYDYDEYGRNTQTNTFTSESGEYVNSYRITTSYGNLENEETEKIAMNGSVKADGTYTPSMKVVQHFNKFGSETYYAAYRDNQGEWAQQSEEIRYMDEYNWFLGGDYYVFVNGERKPDSKERFIYPDDFDPTLGYQTPIEGRQWLGTGIGDTADWKLRTVNNFTWGPRDVMIGYVNYDYMQSDGNKTTGWEMEYDFAANAANIFMWPTNNNQVYYENKTLKSIHYDNPQYWNGNDEWMPEYSYTFTYFYSPRTNTGIEAAELPNGVVETERYDLMGRPLTEPTTGINIVRYSDGSSRKVMVK
ncbi:MAG: hypothetical protein HDR88_07910 [Bacteroides sp.]|nr:hypothetical protein [Bacteroides sp.]